MNDDKLLQHALCALQEAYDYLEAMSFDDSDLSECKNQIQDCYDTLDSKNLE